MKKHEQNLTFEKLKNFMMKQLLILLLLAVSIVGCKNEPKIDYALFSGKIEHANADKLTIKGAGFDKEVKINPDGTFADTLKLSRSGFYSLNVGREFTMLYLKNGYDLKMNLDAQSFDETIIYTGKGETENNYLAAKSLKNENSKADPVAFYGKEEQAYKAEIENIHKRNAEILNSLSNPDKDFVASEQKNLDYDKYLGFKHLRISPCVLLQTTHFKVSDTFLPKELKDMKYDDADAYTNSSSYKQLAYGKTLDAIFETIGDDYNNATVDDFKAINDIKIPALKDDVFSYLGKFMVSPSNPNMESIHGYLVSNTSNDETKKNINETYEKNKNLVKGMPSPQFVNYENHKGGKTSLADLKGKYVYIDVWATWCGPCKREIPFLKEVEKKYHGKNIEFVSTSIDVAKDHDTWVEMVKNEQLGGVQLMADNNWKSKFVTDYAIEGIPRFILIDPNGNIVDADAPRPSDPKLIKLFNALNI
ncbi:MAG: TlpA disulfide reductase family protein [Gelidibacter sp.]